MDAAFDNLLVTVGEHLLHDATNGIDVATCVYLVAMLDEFWRCIASRGSEHALLIVAVVVGKAKVDKTYIMILASDKDITTLKVVVNQLK